MRETSRADCDIHIWDKSYSTGYKKVDDTVCANLPICKYANLRTHQKRAIQKVSL